MFYKVYIHSLGCVSTAKKIEYGWWQTIAGNKYQPSNITVLPN